MQIEEEDVLREDQSIIAYVVNRRGSRRRTLRPEMDERRMTSRLLSVSPCSMR